MFGKVNAKKLLPEHVRTYLDKRGVKSKTQANRRFSLLSTIFSWGFERGYVTVNPCKGVRKFSEQARTRYVEDIEYQAVYDVAPIPLKVAMEISYLCGARQGDVLKITKAQLRQEGIFIKQAKTGKEQIKTWSTRLHTAIELAATVQTTISSIYVIQQANGSKYTSSGFQTMWSRAVTLAKAKTDMELDFTFHDLKAKSISDYEGDKQKFSGHKTASQVAVYDRKTPIIESLNFDKK